MNTDLSNAEIEASESTLKSAQYSMAAIEAVAKGMKQGQVFERTPVNSTFANRYSEEGADIQEASEFEEALKLAKDGDYHNAGVMLNKARENAVLLEAASYLGLYYDEIKEACDAEQKCSVRDGQAICHGAV